MSMRQTLRWSHQDRWKYSARCLSAASTRARRCRFTTTSRSSKHHRSARRADRVAGADRRCVPSAKTAAAKLASPEAVEAARKTPTAARRLCATFATTPAPCWPGEPALFGHHFELTRGDDLDDAAPVAHQLGIVVERWHVAEQNRR